MIRKINMVALLAACWSVAAFAVPIDSNEVTRAIDNWRHRRGTYGAKIFPDVAFGYDLVKDLDTRIGFCMDVGWDFGCCRDSAETIRKYGDRIYDIHLKNFAVDIPGEHILSKEVPHSFTTVPMSRGKIDYYNVFKALADVGYDGGCSFEYERDFEDNLGGLADPSATRAAFVIQSPSCRENSL